METRILSNGSKWAGEEPDAVDQLCDVLKGYPLDRAETAEQKSDSLYKHAHAMANCIPFGQPILVGHYSEGRDRRFREKLNWMRRTSGWSSWDGKNVGTREVDAPALLDGDVLLFDEPGRCGGLDSHCYHYRVVKRAGLSLLVRHGGSRYGRCAGKRR
jgi:hypothetical protein